MVVMATSIWIRSDYRVRLIPVQVGRFSATNKTRSRLIDLQNHMDSRSKMPSYESVVLEHLQSGSTSNNSKPDPLPTKPQWESWQGITSTPRIWFTCGGFKAKRIKSIHPVQVQMVPYLCSSVLFSADVLFRAALSTFIDVFWMVYGILNKYLRWSFACYTRRVSRSAIYTKAGRHASAISNTCPSHLNSRTLDEST